MSNLQTRVGIILALVLASVWALWPRPVIERQRGANGEFVYGPDSTFVYDTVNRINLKRGLDLQGGMHLALEVDESKGAVANKSEALDHALTVVRNRIDEFGVAEPVVQKEGADRIIVELPGIDDPERATRVVQRSAFLEFQIVDETQALDRVMSRLDQIVRERGGSVAASIAGTAGATGTAQAAPSLGGLFAGADSAKRDTLNVGGGAAGRDSASDSSTLLAGATTGGFSRLLRQGRLPGEYIVAMRDLGLVTRYLAMPEIKAAIPPGKELLWGTDTVSVGQDPHRSLYVLDERPILTGEYLVSAKPQTDPMEGALVQFTLTNEGGRRFKNETGKHLKDYLATVLDERVVSNPAVIQSAIGTRGQITMGGSDISGAQEFATVLNAGKLPVPLKVVELRDIGPSLGQDAVRQGLQAGLLSLVLVVVIMVVYYKFSGVLAVVGLLFYALTTLAFLAMVDAVLTLPGIAGFILSIGMAVDANFLQFERIREELDRGHTPRTAIDEGFKNSFSAILDTHATTALTAIVLYQYGTGPVQGFAVTLLAGVASSMLSSVFVVRTLFLAWLQSNRGIQTVSI
jgi:protein-export membrane protein SecD